MYKTKLVLVALSLVAVLGSTAQAGTSSSNDLLFNAMSPFEDLTEYALDNNTARTEQGIKSLDQAIHKLDGIMSAEGVDFLLANTVAMRTAMRHEDFAKIALLAVDSYKNIAAELDASTLKTPLEVVMLDYVGFKIHALLKQDVINWHDLKEVSDESGRLWQGIKIRVSDRGLRDTMNTAIRGIDASVKLRNVEMLDFAGQVDLDLVDLLEGYFENNRL